MFYVSRKRGRGDGLRSKLLYKYIEERSEKLPFAPVITEIPNNDHEDFSFSCMDVYKKAGRNNNPAFLGYQERSPMSARST